MSGPTVTLLLADRRESSSSSVAAILAHFCDVIDGASPGEFEIRVREGGALGLDIDRAEPEVFDLEVGDRRTDSDEDYSAVHPSLVRTIVMAAARSGPRTDRVLGNLALYLARRLDALVDFDGLIGPEPWIPHGDRREDEQRSRLARSFVADMPGKLVEAAYTTGRGTRWYSHIGDVEFLEQWLGHPSFHLIN